MNDKNDKKTLSDDLQADANNLNPGELTNIKTEGLTPAPVKRLKPEEIRKLSNEELANYYGQLMVEGLNNPENHDKSN